MKYRVKSIEVEAIQWTGNNIKEMSSFIKKRLIIDEDGILYIGTLEGKMKAHINDYIICGVNGEYYPCKPDIFNKTYEYINVN